MPKRWKYRYTVLVIMFMTYLLCYMDRMVMATAIPFIADEFGLTTLEMGGVMSAFFFSSIFFFCSAVALKRFSQMSKVAFIMLLEMWARRFGRTSSRSEMR